MTSEGSMSGPPYSRKNPFLARLACNQLLTKPGSEKETRHLVVDISGSGLRYTPGDSLGVFARNPPQLVDELIQVLGLPADAPVRDPKGNPSTLRDTLLRDYILNRALKRIMASLVERIPQGEQRNKLMTLLEDDKQLTEYLFTRDYIDILREFNGARFSSPEGFLSQLGPVVPRLYSIASSQQMHPDEVHLIVAVVRYENHGRPRSGFASGFLADLAGVGRPDLPVFIQESKSFRLPADGTRDIIMVGPGTGIAPFRAFLEKRTADGASGRNWLIFGEQHRATDFFYEEDFRHFQEIGKLQRLDTAFSRDQAQKIYVQHRMLEHAAELWRWLEGGAYFYVCGDARRMAKDVHQTLIQIVEEQGGMTREAAGQYVNVTLMKTEKRYLRDIY